MMGINDEEREREDWIGEHHIGTSMDTALRADAFAIDDELKMELIEKHFKEIMQILGLDLTDDSLKGTPRRVAKMYVKELFSGLDPKNAPSVTMFENKFHYKEMVVIKDITFYTVCEHHFIPFFGKAHVGYIPNGKVAGLSKVNRLVQFYAKRPQVQERLTIQVCNAIQEHFGIEHVAVIMEAEHLCVGARGVQDVNSTTVTSKFGGLFNKEDIKAQFFNSIQHSLNK